MSVDARIAGQGDGGKLHDLGYRRYTGARRVGPQLWRVLARQGFKSAIKTWYIIVVLTIASFPMIYGGVLLWVPTKAGTAVAREIGVTVGSVFLSVGTAQRFFAFVAALLVGSSMLTDDFRSGGVTFYFARPVTRGVYLVGKMVPVGIIVACILGVPYFIMSLEVISLSGDGAMVLVLAKAMVMVALTTIVLCALAALISALVRNRLLGSGLYFGIYVGSKVVGKILAGALGEHWPNAISISLDLHAVGQWLFGEPPDAPPVIAACILAGLSIASFMIAYRRLRRVDILG